MLYFAMPDAAPVPVYETTQVALAAANSGREMKLGVCNFAFAKGDSDVANELAPSKYMQEFLPKELLGRLSPPVTLSQEEAEWYADWSESFSVEVLRKPGHGQMVPNFQGKYENYFPNKGYIGKDRVDFLVKGVDDKGRPISMTLIYYINVLSEKSMSESIVNRQTYQRATTKYCGTTKDFWQINQNQGVSSFDVGTSSTTPGTTRRRLI